MGDVVVVEAGAGAEDDDEDVLVTGPDVVGVVDGGAATDDGSPVSQCCEACTAPKLSAEMAKTPATPTITTVNGRSLKSLRHARIVKRWKRFKKAAWAQKHGSTANQQARSEPHSQSHGHAKSTFTSLLPQRNSS